MTTAGQIAVCLRNPGVTQCLGPYLSYTKHSVSLGTHRWAYIATYDNVGSETHCLDEIV